MTTTYHTPLAFGGPLTQSAMEKPLGQLDAAIATVIATGSGASTTLTAIASAGTASLQVASSASFLVGDNIYIGTGATFEARTITVIPDATHITVGVNLTNTYASGLPVSKSPVELVDAREGAISLRTRLTRLKRGLNIADYGAVGDNTTDDTTAIQACLDAATVPGQEIFFPFTPSGYKISALLNITARPLHLVGESGINSTSLIIQATANTGAINIGALGDGTVIEHLAVKGTGAQTTSKGVYSNKTCTLVDVRAQAFFDGIYLDASSFYSRLDNCFAYQNLNAGIRLVNCYNTTILSCRSHSNVYGIHGGGFTGLRIIGCATEQNTSRGIHLDGVATSLLISGGYFESATGTADIYLGPSAQISGVTIEGCIFFANAVAGFWHIDSFAVDHLTIIGCDIQAAGAGGGALRTSAGTTNPLLLNTKTVGTVTIVGVGNATGGLVLGTANLYNVDTDILKTDDAFHAVKGLKTFVKAGAPVDGDFPTSFVGDGIIVLDTTNSRIYCRIAGGSWKSVVVA